MFIILTSLSVFPPLSVSPFNFSFSPCLAFQCSTIWPVCRRGRLSMRAMECSFLTMVRTLILYCVSTCSSSSAYNLLRLFAPPPLSSGSSSASSIRAVSSLLPSSSLSRVLFLGCCCCCCCWLELRLCQMSGFVRRGFTEAVW